MDTQKTVSKSHALQAESLSTTKGISRTEVSSGGKLQVKQKVKRPNYKLRLL
jgi:hypothetical protein